MERSRSRLHGRFPVLQLQVTCRNIALQHGHLVFEIVRTRRERLIVLPDRFRELRGAEEPVGGGLLRIRLVKQGLFKVSGMHEDWHLRRRLELTASSSGAKRGGSGGMIPLSSGSEDLTGWRGEFSGAMEDGRYLEGALT